MDVGLSAVYLPSAIALGALHALEPGHAKTLTAAYLIGIKGTKWDAVLLGLSVAITHSAVVVALAAAGVLVGRESFTADAMYWLQVASGGIVVLLGSWLLLRRFRQLRASSPPPHDHDHDHDHVHSHDHGPDHNHDHDHDHDHHHHHDHDHLSDDEHARAHAATIPDYAKRGERPSSAQIIAFGAAGGMIPCPASITVMLLAVSLGEQAKGLLLVAGFSLGLAITLVAVGLAVVAGLSRLQSGGKFAWLTRQAPLISAAMVILSGLFALLVALTGAHTHA